MKTRLLILLSSYLIAELISLNSPCNRAFAHLTNFTPTAISQSTADSTWYNCLTREVWTEAKQDWCNNLNRLQNGNYVLPNYGEITLSNGSYENSAQRYRVILINREGLIDFGDLNNDGKQEAVFLLTVNSGGSGQFIY